MAEKLGLSPKTMDRHRTNLMEKIGVHSVAQLLAYALKEGLLDRHHHSRATSKRVPEFSGGVKKAGCDTNKTIGM